MRYEEMDGHTVLVGWRGAESERLVRLLLSDTATDDEGLVLVAAEVGENPEPDAMRFVATRSYADSDAYPRAAIATADRIIVNTSTDDQTLAAVLAVMAHRPRAHVVAHFEDDSALALVRAHYPRVECIRPMSAEIIARAAQDPGSSALTFDLLTADSGVTQFSLAMPLDATVADIAACLKRHGAMLIGVRESNGAALALNPPERTIVPRDGVLYYLADARIAPTVLDCLRSIPA